MLFSWGNATAVDLFQCFDRAFVINLTERPDRRRDMERQLKRLGPLRPERIEFFQGVRPQVRDDWPSLGCRGNFLSHYMVLREARDRDLKSVVILEDDCSFTPTFAHLQHVYALELGTHEWGIAHLGHVEPFSADLPPGFRRWNDGVRTTHFYAVSGQVIGPLVDYLEAVQSRPAGHPLGGPQYYDGALSTFRAQNPDVITLLAIPSLGRQRSSRSDLNAKWYDETPIMREVANGMRRCVEYWRGR